MNVRVCLEVKKFAAAVLSGALLCLPGISGRSAEHISTERQDSAWKRYYNTQASFCVSYPAKWIKGDAYDGAGIFVEAGLGKRSRPSGEIDVAVLPSGGAATKLTLVDDLQTHLDGLKKFGRAQRLEVLDRREMTLLGNSALFSKHRYYDPMDGSSWINEVVLANYHDQLYRLELECRADQISRFEAVFTHLLSTFQFECPQGK